jgi:hypothetical protein
MTKKQTICEFNAKLDAAKAPLAKLGIETRGPYYLTTLLRRQTKSRRARKVQEPDRNEIVSLSLDEAVSAMLLFSETVVFSGFCDTVRARRTSCPEDTRVWQIIPQGRTDAVAEADTVTGALYAVANYLGS